MKLQNGRIDLAGHPSLFLLPDDATSVQDPRAIRVRAPKGCETGERFAEWARNTAKLLETLKKVRAI